jgi:hypothetical protein
MSFCLAAALGLSACTPSANARLAKNLIATSALERPPWNMHHGSGETLNPYGFTPSGVPLRMPEDVPEVIQGPNAAAVRQWVPHLTGLASGPLPDAVFSVIDRAARFKIAGDAHAFATVLARGYGGDAQPVEGVAAARVLTAPFVGVPGGRATGRECLIVIDQRFALFTVLIVGGGSHPTDDEVRSLAKLQAAAIKR